MSDKVKRWDIDTSCECGRYGDDVNKWESPDGEFVLAADYEALEQRNRELEAENKRLAAQEKGKAKLWLKNMLETVRDIAMKESRTEDIDEATTALYDIERFCDRILANIPKELLDRLEQAEQQLSTCREELATARGEIERLTENAHGVLGLIGKAIAKSDTTDTHREEA